jgi:hypothetical protein
LDHIIEIWGDVPGAGGGRDAIFANITGYTVTSSSVPDGGATVTQFGAALTGLAMLRRRFIK